MRKAQSALEYLIVYGWVFIIIVIVGAALYYLGVFNPQGDISSATEESFQTDEIGVLDHQLLEAGTWALKLHPRGYDLDVTKIIIDNKEYNFNEYIPNGKTELFTGDLGVTGELGDTYQYDMYIYYTKRVSGFSHVAAGVFAGIVEGNYNVTSTSQPTMQTPGSWHQTSQADFSLGITSNTNYNLEPGSIVLDLKDNWFNENFKYRTQITVTEESGNDLTNQPYYFTLNTANLIANNKMKNNAEDLRVIINNQETAYQVENGTLNTANTKIWILLNISAGATKIIQAYYGNPDAISTSYSTDLSYTTGDNGYFENNKIYARVGNNNNPSYWGFDTIYEKNNARDIVNYYSYLLNRDNNQAHLVTTTDSGPIYVEFTMSGSGYERNNEALTYRLYTKNNIIRWMMDDNAGLNYSAWLGWDNTEIDTFESNGETHTLTPTTTNHTFTNLTYSYVRLYNQTSNYGIAMFSPVHLNQSDVSGGTNGLVDDYMGLSNTGVNTSVEYYDYYIGELTQPECETLANISTNQPTTVIGSEEELYQSYGMFTSTAYNTGYDDPDYNTLAFWKTNTTDNKIRVRLRTGDTESEVNTAPWQGPTSTSDYYDYNQAINSIHDDERWVQYRVYLSTTNTTSTPVFQAINISFLG